MSKGRAGIFNEEKVLYFANREAGLHVQEGEPRGSDLNVLVQRLASKGLIRQSPFDGSGFMYRATMKGQERLLELQIQWRENNGKDVDEHKQKLDEVRQQLRAEA